MLPSPVAEVCFAGFSRGPLYRFQIERTELKCDHASGIAWDRHFPAIPPLLRRDWKLNRDAFEAPQSEELPEGLYLATSDELPGLVAQGRTVAETLEIARDVARKLIEARRERDGAPNLPASSDRRDYTIVVAA